MSLSPIMTVMVGAARKAGRSLTRDFGEVEQLQVSIKGPANFVSAADHRAEDILFNELSRARPDYGFLMEERGTVASEADSPYRFIVDPLDGTTNFLHSNPMFSISIGLERDGEILAGVIYAPILDEMFMAEKGRGAFLADRTGRDRRIRVGARKGLDEALITLGIPHRGRSNHPRFIAQTTALMKEVAGLRRTGSAALDLAWVAAGRFDAYFEYGLGAWDLAAGTIIVKEAGGAVSDCAGGQTMLTSGDIVAGNATIQRAIVAQLKAHGG
jgi:myo-inositol-1(or 4)-monophosphatase